MELKPKSLFDRYCLLWIILIHAFYFGGALIIRSIYTLDSYEYIWQAANLKTHFSNYCWDPAEPIRTEFYTRRTILYGFLLMLSRLIYSSDFTILVFQNILSIINLYFFGKLFRGYRFSFNSRPIILTAFVLFPTWFIYTNMVMSESILATCIFWAFYHFVRYVQQGKVSSILLYNLFLTLAVLTKPVLMYFWIPNLLLMLYLFSRQRQWSLLVWPLLMPLAIIMHSMANKQVTGYFHYCSIKNHNLLHYNSQILLAHAGGLDWSKQQVDSIQKMADRMPDFKSYNEFIVKECTRIHKENFATFLKIQSGGMLNFFIDPGRYDMEQFFPPKNVLRMSFFHQFREKGISGVIEYIRKMPMLKMSVMVLVMIWNAFVVLSLLIFVFNRRVEPLIRILVVFLAAYVCVFTGPMGDSRFKMAIYPLLVFTIPFFIEQMDRKRTAKAEENLNTVKKR
jgi:hypothetical protein